MEAFLELILNGLALATAVWITVVVLLAVFGASSKAGDLFSAPFKWGTVLIGVILVWVVWKPLLWLLGAIWGKLVAFWRFLWTPWGKPPAPP